ncbi:MAG: transcriptional repressor [Pirellulales bacterium]|nr:transcriptional repressor [Pirellulales bacterium]
MKSDRVESLKRLEKICHARGMPLTSQRSMVLEVLLQRDDHPTADQVLEAVRSRSPRISRRTVYRVLDTLAELGLIRRVHHPGARARFDAKMHRHHHLVCTRCNRIVDLESRRFDDIALPKGKSHGFKVYDYSVQLVGICPDCQKKQGRGKDSPSGLFHSDKENLEKNSAQDS